MKKTIFSFLAWVAISANAQYQSKVWSPDNGDGTYTNPVINADYSDPDVCVSPSGEDYYLTASSFHAGTAHFALERPSELGDYQLCHWQPL